MDGAAVRSSWWVHLIFEEISSSGAFMWLLFWLFFHAAVSSFFLQRQTQARTAIHCDQNFFLVWWTLKYYTPGCQTWFKCIYVLRHPVNIPKIIVFSLFKEQDRYDKNNNCVSFANIYLKPYHEWAHLKQEGNVFECPPSLKLSCLI